MDVDIFEDASTRPIEIDRNFVDALEVMNSLQVNYWVCNGTLLGLVRDGALIEWDPEIDFAIWREDLDLVAINAEMRRMNFTMQSNRNEVNNFKWERPGGRQIDINVMSREVIEGVEMAEIVWDVHVSRGVARVLGRSLRRFAKFIEDALLRFRAAMPSMLSGGGSRQYGNGQPNIRLGRYPLTGCLSFIERVLPKQRRKYSYPTKYLEPLSKRCFFGLTVPVPYSPEMVCAQIYGDDWMVPRRSERWHEFTLPA